MNRSLGGASSTGFDIFDASINQGAGVREISLIKESIEGGRRKNHRFGFAVGRDEERAFGGLAFVEVDPQSFAEIREACDVG
jgi:hypothetical protein